VLPGKKLVPSEFDRYSRQLSVPDLGVAGQRRLKAARVAVIGAGGLGSPVLSYLAAAGVGHLTILDADTVAESNLHRQLLHGSPDIGRNKIDSAADALRRIRPDVDLITHAARLDHTNAADLLTGYDIIVDGSDNFDTHYCADDTAARLRTPCVWGSVLRWQGQTGVSWAEYGPRYRDLYPVPPNDANTAALSCATGGVVGTVCAVIGSVMATETIKLITGCGSVPLGRVLMFDGTDSSFRQLRFQRRSPAPDVELCTVTAPVSGHRRLADNNAVTDHAYAEDTEISVVQLADELHGGAAPVLIDVREPQEHTAGAIAGSRLVPLSTIVATAQQQRGGAHGGAEHDSTQQHIADLLSPLSVEQPAVLYCEHGIRSAHALAVLRQCGFTALRHLSGGYDAWCAASRRSRG
jgi:adenylyltransferase/sulfurtransferase